VSYQTILYTDAAVTFEMLVRAKIDELTTLKKEIAGNH
jgi:hypothetical protein